VHYPVRLVETARPESLSIRELASPDLTLFRPG
jgi:hypothetical protein